MSARQITGVCRLCLSQAQLRKSHIVPKFLHRDLFDEKRHLLGIHGQGKRGVQPLQDGLKDRLLCDSCEQHFNDNLEKPFDRLWKDQTFLSGPLAPGQVIDIAVDYASFKLFHLSVLFRAGVSPLRTFRFVSLGRHEQRIRTMLLQLDPGRPSEYPVAGSVVVFHRTNAPLQLVTCPFISRVDGHTYYVMMYGGVQWYVRVSSHPSPGFDVQALKPDGSLSMLAEDWRDLHTLRIAGSVMRGEMTL